MAAAAPGTTAVLLSTDAADDLPATADRGAVAYLRTEDLTPSALRAPVAS